MRSSTHRPHEDCRDASAADAIAHRGALPAVRQLCRRHAPRTALRRDEYEDYLNGRSTACAILVAAVIAFHSPVPLAEPRRGRDAFVAPQSYRFVDERQIKTLLDGQAAELTAPTAQLTLRV
jgi:hypothetical protein